MHLYDLSNNLALTLLQASQFNTQSINSGEQCVAHLTSTPAHPNLRPETGCADTRDAHPECGT